MQRAFTLIEVMAVVALLGLLSGATVWSLAENAQHSSRENIIGQIAYADRMARLASQRLGNPCSLQFDLDQDRIWRVASRDERHHATTHALKLPVGHRIDRIVIPRTSIATQGATTQTTNENIDSGTVDIAYSTAGHSTTYAIRIEGENEQWLVFSGLTGQPTLIYDQDEIDNLFAMLTAGRSDAD